MPSRNNCRPVVCAALASFSLTSQAIDRERSKFGSSWNIPDIPGQFAGNKKPAEPIAMRVFGYFSALLQTALDAACETVVGADGLEPPTYAL